MHRMIAASLRLRGLYSQDVLVKNMFPYDIPFVQHVMWLKAGEAWPRTDNDVAQLEPRVRQCMDRYLGIRKQPFIYFMNGDASCDSLPHVHILIDPYIIDMNPLRCPGVLQ
jgi:hypothetical protein